MIWRLWHVSAGAFFHEWATHGAEWPLHDREEAPHGGEWPTHGNSVRWDFPYQSGRHFSECNFPWCNISRSLARTRAYI